MSGYATTLRLLVPGSSNDLIDGADGQATALCRVAAVLERSLRERVELRHVAAYPTPGLARYATRIVDEFDPDIVLPHTFGHMVGPETLAFRVERLLGRGRSVRYQQLVDRLRHYLGVDAAPSPARQRSFVQALHDRTRDALRRLGWGPR